MMPSSIIHSREAAIALAHPGVMLLTREQAEQATGLCSKTLSKHVPPVRIGRAVRWRPADIQQWIDGLGDQQTGGAR